jgi:hydrogenase expression/formation protein HypC
MMTLVITRKRDIMCLAIPSRIIAREGDLARVECFGVERDVSLMLLPEPVEIGDYVLIQNGSFAMEKVDRDLAAESLRTLATVIGAKAQ